MDGFDIVKAARAVLQAATKGSHKPSPATVAEYKRVFKRLIEGQDGTAQIDKVINRATDTRSRNTWFKHRAALRFVAITAIQKRLPDQDRIQRQLRNNPEDAIAVAEWKQLIRELNLYTSMINAIPDGCPIPDDKRRPAHSKKKDIHGLPGDWIEILMRRMGKYQKQFLVTACTGCRPAELAQGIELRVDEHGLVATIKGKKVIEESNTQVRHGQPWRKFTWTIPKGGLVDLLTALVREAGGVMTIRFDDENGATNFSTAIRDAARREWPTRVETITPYCLRHAFSAELKAAKLPRKLIAAAMGHAVDTTCQHYGTARQASKNAIVPDEIECAWEVRERFVHNPPPPSGKITP